MFVQLQGRPAARPRARAAGQRLSCARVRTRLPVMLVNCVAYQNGHKLADIDKSDISVYIARPDCFVWVALSDSNDAELAEMKEEFGLPELAIEDALHGHQRPKIEEYGESIFAVVHTVEPGNTRGDFNVGEVNIFVGRNYVLSVRTGMSRGFADVRARCEREPELLRFGSGYVLYALMDAVVDRYFPLLDQLEVELDVIEAQIFSGKTERRNIEALYELKSKLMTLRHATASLAEASNRLFGGRVPPVCVGMGDYFRDVHDHLVRLNAHIDSIREMVTTAISVNLAMISLSENEVTKRLAAYAALVAVPTMIAGIYGMNFEHMPELGWAFGYPVALISMVVIDTWLVWRFRKAGWM